MNNDLVEHKKIQNKLLSQIEQKTFERFKNLREAFLKFDNDRSGHITREEFRIAMANCGLPLTDEEFEVIDSSYPHQEGVDEFDKGISYVEFARLISGELTYTPGAGQIERQNSSASSPSKTLSKSSSQNNAQLSILKDTFSKKVFSEYKGMKQAFKVADKDGSGFLDKSEFKTLLKSQLNLTATDDEINSLLDLFDTNGDGKLAYHEFVKCLHTY
jgi:Ca2+-binding EF-hand superfamily protein